jgi:hypothetical protein
LYSNTLRFTVRHDATNSRAVILSVVAAVYSERYERPSQLAFLDDGVRVAAGSGVAETEVSGWPTLRDLIDEVNTREMIAFGCADCAAARGVSLESPISGLEWVAYSDVRLPLHGCGPDVPSAERLTLVTVEQQRADQRAFDDLVGRVTLGADRGEE